MRMSRLTAWLLVPLALTTSTTCHRRPGPLRVCADPNNLPFSNRAGEGLENRIAGLVAGDLGTTVEYTWWAQRRGFVRNTLGAGLCDVILGVPRGFDPTLQTRPYYRSSYVFVSKQSRRLAITSFDDEALRHLRVGVHVAGDDYGNLPPAHALARRGIIRNVVGYSLYGDYTTPNPPARLVEAVARDEVDVAVVWGPLAGYFGRAQDDALAITPVTPTSDGPAIPFVFDIAMGVRRGDTVLRDRLDEVIERRKPAIDTLLAAFGVPLLDGAAEGAGVIPAASPAPPSDRSAAGR